MSGFGYVVFWKKQVSAADLAKWERYDRWLDVLSQDRSCWYSSEQEMTLRLVSEGLQTGKLVRSTIIRDVWSIERLP